MQKNFKTMSKESRFLRHPAAAVSRGKGKATFAEIPSPFFWQ